MSERKPSVQSVERAIEILKSFSADETELGVGEISRRINLPKSTVFRLLSTLESKGFVGQNTETGKYHLGIEIIPLANSVYTYSNLRRIARPYLHNLVVTLEETASLCVLHENEIITLDQIEFRGRLVVRTGGIEQRKPFHAVSSGKVIVAFYSAEDLNKLLETPLKAFTPMTIIDADTFRQELSLVRDMGYATSFDELEQGLHALSAPIHDHEGKVISCVVVSGPSYRLDRSRIGEISSIVIQAADQISRELGYIYK